MPVEIEYKLILSNNLTTENYLSGLETYNIVSMNLITQNYLNGGGRTRSLLDILTSRPCVYEFTYKDSLPIGDFEINKDLSEEDYKLSKSITKLSFMKNRITFKTKSHKWEIDLFHKNEKIYFALIECEVPEENTVFRVDELPEFLRNDIVYTPLLGDSRFTSKKLADVNYATNLLKEIKNKGE